MLPRDCCCTHISRQFIEAAVVILVYTPQVIGWLENETYQGVKKAVCQARLYQAGVPLGIDINVEWVP